MLLITPHKTNGDNIVNVIARAQKMKKRSIRHTKVD